MTPTLSILLINYKGLHFLKECLPSLKLQSYQDFEIIFVDNNSEDGSVEWVQEFLDQHNIPGHSMNSGANLGFAGGNNFGLPYCQGEWIYFLNNDTTLPENSLAQLMGATQQYPDHKIFGPLMIQAQATHLVDSLGDALYTAGPSYNGSGTQVASISSDLDISSVCAGAALYHQSVLQEIGHFDEDFWLIFEDVDLSLRAQNAGYGIKLIPQSQVLHQGSASIGRTSDIAYYYSSRNLHWVRLKNYPVSLLVKYALQVTITSLLGLKGGVTRGQGRLWFKAKFNAWKLYPKMWAKRSQTRKKALKDKEFEALLKKGWFRSKLGL